MSRLNPGEAMRIWLSGAAVALFLAGGAVAAPTDWSRLTWLQGDWTAVGGGGGQGGFSFRPGANGQVLLRLNHADFPAQGAKPAEHHEDLMVVYHEGDADKATYWDSEGHVIHYDVGAAGADTVTFISNDASGPRYRLTYKRTQSGLDGSFEIAPPAAREQFKPYLQWTAVKVPG
jgi:hypothetical protein